MHDVRIINKAEEPRPPLAPGEHTICPEECRTIFPRAVAERSRGPSCRLGLRRWACQPYFLCFGVDKKNGGPARRAAICVSKIDNTRYHALRCVQAHRGARAAVSAFRDTSYQLLYYYYMYE